MGGVTPLIMCVKMANHSMLQQLITKNVDIAATDNEGKNKIIIILVLICNLAFY